jgi:hypothetical protein
MSSHADTNQNSDTIRRAVSALLAQDSWQKPLCIDAIQALDALLAENQQLRETLREIEREAKRLPFANAPYEVAAEIERLAAVSEHE